jgi:multidrug efflux pump subunit AcrB
MSEHPFSLTRLSFVFGIAAVAGIFSRRSLCMVDHKKTPVYAVIAAGEAGTTRFLPVIMTALAMIIGMLPMSLGLGEGGEQNAPLGRAVIGGLLFATVATLFFVPVFFSIVHRRRAEKA